MMCGHQQQGNRWNGFGLVAFAKKGMEVDVPACAYSFAREFVNGLIIWDHSL